MSEQIEAGAMSAEDIAADVALPADATDLGNFVCSAGGERRFGLTVGEAG